MTTQAMFVDLPNFYSHLLESEIDKPRLLRDYFLNWFDFDRLSRILTSGFSPVWVFYSGRRFGPKDNQVKDKYLDDFINRTNSLKGVTARDVDIEGKQRESASYECEECGHRGIAQWESEKGIDASLTVHLFETMDTWDVAYLLSGDADFVPVVSSLRRRGKIVTGAGFAKRSSALIRECYDYIDLWNLFFKEDVLAYRIFAADGIAVKWLMDEISPQSDNSPIEITFEWQFRSDHILIYLTTTGSFNFENRLKEVEKLRIFSSESIGIFDSAKKQYLLTVSTGVWRGVERRLAQLTNTLSKLKTFEASYSGKGFTAKYEFNVDSQKYELV